MNKKSKNCNIYIAVYYRLSARHAAWYADTGKMG